ncbi:MULTISPECIES: terpene synthase [Bacillales]|uniref:Terpene synthase n=1 Tax=Lysinibacillus halotolerans TaxID=1368476 RepID=A0A3M8H172_9BACI|nr:terpene synthase [Lysinibacillus halotolerans]RNC96202.1 terpene synthase [Lysinibacillus halotolerans]
MISIDRKLRLRDLEIFRFYKENKVLAYVIIEDTRGPFTEEDKKLEPLCFLDEEDLNEIVNVFKIYLLTDEPLEKNDSIMLREFFGNLVDISSVTSFIIQEFVQEDLYEHVDDSWDIKTYQRMLDIVGSKYEIQPIHEKNWLNLSQE